MFELYTKITVHFLLNTASNHDILKLWSDAYKKWTGRAFWLYSYRITTYLLMHLACHIFLTSLTDATFLKNIQLPSKTQFIPCPKIRLQPSLKYFSGTLITTILYFYKNTYIMKCDHFHSDHTDCEHYHAPCTIKRQFSIWSSTIFPAHKLC